MGKVLVDVYGEQPWILQLMEAVMICVHRGVNQLGSSQGPSANAQPVDLQSQGYAMPARTKEDVIRENPGIETSPADIPSEGNSQRIQQGLQTESNDMFARLSGAVDPAAQQLGRPAQNEAMPQKPKQITANSSGLILPSDSNDSDWSM